ncbi:MULTISPECIES: hypothetical protein [unclassified Psychrobacillus]|uniref:hypothetical protein n=1 Tax=unclassified Psychrobacillus TaxID=2636677 RepID=UPI00146D6141|nr:MULTISPECIES: hypothetical protein [unclassified Psychrobacillus]MCM3358951.1 hypothetical protein [Psychrobacillus sp. MER TA 171]NME05110.1 hypothetical protein [Psychrobacillus sp. BL-248-WT-3]
MSSLNDPILYISGPPVFHLPPQIRSKEEVEIVVDETIIEEESTSIYEIKNTMSAKNNAIFEKLKFLSKPFQRKVYRPLSFHMADGSIIQGEVQEVTDEQVIFSINGESIETYPVHQVKKIFWRGSILK